MAIRSLSVLAVLAAGSAIIFQTYVYPILLTFGFVGRIVQPISDFPYTCHKLTHPLLQGCEDLFLDEQSRHLYAVCQPIADRHSWSPFAHDLNFTARSKTGGSLISIDFDKLTDTEANVADVLTKHLPHPNSGFASVLGDGDNTFDVLGFGGQRHVSPTGLLQIHLVNQRPIINASTGTHIDNVDYDPSIELFEEVPAASTSASGPTFTHVATYSDPLIVRPNRVVSDGHGGFYVSNDHSARASEQLLSFLEILTGGGGVVHCEADPSRPCRTVVGPAYGPNGITRTRDGRIILPATEAGNLHVYEQMHNFDLKLIEKIVLRYPVDNLSPDANGDLWAAALPGIFDALSILNSKDTSRGWKSTVLRIKRKDAGSTAETDSEYEWAKMLEDEEAIAIDGTTTAAHDVKTGSIFTAGLVSPSITICRPRKV